VGCEFDQLVQKRLAQGRALKKDGRAESWRRTLDKRPVFDRKCRHMLTGDVALKYCANNFDCARCEYDQMLEDTQLGLEPAAPPVSMVAGFSLPANYYFDRGHVWARVEYGGRVRVGIDDFAARLLGPPDAWDLPRLGQAVSVGASTIQLRRGEHQARVRAPVEGVVVAVNPRIEQRARVPHESPFGSGWLLMLEPTRLGKDLRNLLFGPETSAWLEDEAARLISLVSDDTEHRLAATGGRMVDDVYGTVEGLAWDDLVTRFLLG
jgi:glycine cleavage system H lipoate-binding protein